MADLISLKEFRKQIETAVLDEHAETLERSIHRLRAAAAATAAMDRGDATVPQAAEAPTVSASTLAAQEFEGMKGFLVQLYEGTSCDHSFLDAAGNAIDCLPFDQQPTVKAARKKGIEPKSELPPPPELDHPAEFGINSMDSGPKPTGMVAPLRQGKVDLYGNKVATPAGTVPFRRLSLARLAQLGRLDLHFKKAPALVHDPRPVFHAQGGSQATCSGRWRECSYLTCDHEYCERSPLCRVPVRSVAAIGSDLGDFVVLERLESEPGPRCDVALATVDSQQHSDRRRASPDDRVGMADPAAFSAARLRVLHLLQPRWLFHELGLRL